MKDCFKEFYSPEKSIGNIWVDYTKPDCQTLTDHPASWTLLITQKRVFNHF